MSISADLKSDLVRVFAKYPIETYTADELLDAIRGAVCICPICNRYSSKVTTIPEYLREFPPFWLYCGIHGFTRACADCINKANERKCEHDKNIAEENSGIVRHSFRTRRIKPGWVYVCNVWDDVYKIGATVASVEGRLKSQNLDENRLVCVISTKQPFVLENYLHSRYRKKMVDNGKRNQEGTVREWFHLNGEDISFVKGLKSINGDSLFVK